MRTLIAAAAFLVPLLLAVGVGAMLAGSGGERPRLNGAMLGELREFAGSREALLDHYACRPGETSDGMPHLALERFDRRGCDAGGRPWYRLATTSTPVPCGLLQRASDPAPTTAVPPLVDGARPTLILPLTQHWSYWDVVPPVSRPAHTPPKSP